MVEGTLAGWPRLASHLNMRLVKNGKLLIGKVSQVLAATVCVLASCIDGDAVASMCDAPNRRHL